MLLLSFACTHEWVVAYDLFVYRSLARSCMPTHAHRASSQVSRKLNNNFVHNVAHTVVCCLLSRTHCFYFVHAYNVALIHFFIFFYFPHSIALCVCTRCMPATLMYTRSRTASFYAAGGSVCVCVYNTVPKLLDWSLLCSAFCV